MGWLSGWSKRQAITLTGGADGSQADFQLKLSIAYDSDMLSDFSDLRFTKEDGTTLIDAWLEDKTDSTSADVVVEFPSTPANGETQAYYMYYGKSDALSDWDGAATFPDFFDDFEDGDVSDWTQTDTSLGELTAVTTPVKHGNYAGKWHFEGTGTAYSYKQLPELANDPANKVLEWYWRAGQIDHRCTIYLSKDAASYEPSISLYLAEDGNIKYYDGAFHDVKAYNADQWYKNAIVITKGASSSTFDWWIDKDLSETPDVNDGLDRGDATSFIYFELQTSAAGAETLDQFVDAIRVRKYTANPPTYEFGSEENAPSGLSMAIVMHHLMQMRRS